MTADIAHLCGLDSRHRSCSATEVQISLMFLSLQEIRGKPFIYKQGILAKME